MIDHTDMYRGNAYIHTSGERFYMANPTWNVRAIAHALGQNARYNGNGKFFYSVAEHAVLVSLLMEELKLGDPFEGLHHDDHESILSDVPTPFKHLLGPEWSKIDYHLETSVRKHFQLPENKSDGCKKADLLALFIEADALLPERGADFYDPNNLRVEALHLKSERGWHINGYSWKTARNLYLSRHAQLVTGRS